ncbi:hypothetical protein PG997_013805 [Apiospora hydei]|uniref:Extracellular membrane protein CFEM domain-containing protein n=1 Tax=Apiospora hydei TaxID=1337664 RepID=A0ABR1V7A5_9PEZI
MRALSSTRSISSGRPSAIPTLTVLTWLIGHLAAPAAALANDFSSYPSGSQDCLSRAADSSKCSGNTGKDLNECLCTNKGNFVYNTASCVAKDSPSDLDAVYATLQSNCAGTGVTLTVSKDAFMAKAAAATATTAKPSKTKSDGSTPTTPSDSDPTENSTADKGSWSSTAKVGVGVGIGVGASALILVGALLWRRYRRRQLWKQQQGGNGDPGMAVMGGGREYHQPPGNPPRPLPLHERQPLRRRGRLGSRHDPHAAHRRFGQPDDGQLAQVAREPRGIDGLLERERRQQPEQPGAAAAPPRAGPAAAGGAWGRIPRLPTAVGARRTSRARAVAPAKSASASFTP